MNESIIPQTKHYTGGASLAAMGVKLQELDLFGPIRKGVHIAQKTVKHTPIDKLYEGFISLLAGAHGLVEINTRLRSEPALQEAFGRQSCAEQAVVQQSLDACTAENVSQLEQAMDEIYRIRSQGYQHDYQTDWQVLDVDMSGLPVAPKRLSRQRGILPNNAIGGVGKLGGCWLRATMRLSLTASTPAPRNSTRVCSR